MQGNRCGWRKKKRCNCRRSIGGKDKRWSFWKNVKGWRDCNDGNWQCKEVCASKLLEIVAQEVTIVTKIPGSLITGIMCNSKSLYE